jgi:hypothetical protein
MRRVLPVVAAGALRVFVVAGGAALGFMIWRTIDWPIPPNTSVHHYIAWLMRHGYVPYRDAFDINPPGVYLLQLAALTVAGTDDLGVRLWEIAWLLATSGALYLYCRPLADRWAAAAAALLFALYHVGGGTRHAGERDFFLCIFLLLTAWGTARYLERPTAWWPVIGAGLCVGAAAMVKPLAALFGLAGAALIVRRDWQSGRSGWRAASILLMSALVVPAGMLAWLAAAGGLTAAVAIAVEYIPLFADIARNRFDRFTMSYWAVLLAVIAIGGFMRVPAAVVDRRSLAAIGVGYGVLHVILQFKGSWHHHHPFALFMFALVAPALGPADREPPRWPPLARALRLPVLVALVVVVAVQVAARTPQLWTSAEFRGAERVQRVLAVEGDLRRLVPAGGTVQIMDVVEGGGAHALLRAGIFPGTRFISDLMFFHHEQDPRIQALRAEFIAALETHRPAAVAIFPVRWRRQRYDRLRRFPEFTNLLERSYTLVVARDDYRIYLRRGPHQ